MSTGFEASRPDLPLSAADVPVLVGDSHQVGAAAGSGVSSRRVLHLINGEHYAGAERVQDLLAARLPDWGYSVGFACVKPRRFPEARHYRQAPLYDVAMRSRFDLRSIGRLRQIVDEGGYELLHAHTPRTAIVGRLLAARRNLPMVYHVHSPASRDSTRSWLNVLNATMERLSLRRVARLIAVSESLGSYMRQQGYDARRITVVTNGVASPPVVPQRAPPVDAWTLGTIALFRPRKGTEVLLDALAILRRRRLNVRLRAIGSFAEESYRRDLMARVRRLELEPWVKWVGFQSDIHAQLQQLDLFVLPSLFGEGMPMVVLEAMAMGVPVIGTDVEGVPEAVRDGLDGRIARAGDATDLAQAIASVVCGPCCWATLRQNALDRQAEQFSDVAMARRVAAVYDQVLQPAPVSASV